MAPASRRSHRAHPRSRGENRALSTTLVAARGSSPLARGKQRRRQPPRSRRGLIPARAGKTASDLLITVLTPAHPRSRGENQCDAIPRLQVRGLIPARAGKTRLELMSAFDSSAHPRSRGENEIARAEDVNANGSSPLARGKPWAGSPICSQMRLIPARAGKTRACEKPEPKRQAHPRSRGENAGMTHKQIAAAGSSPLARGKPSSTRTRTPIIGLIPARAGKTPMAPDPAGSLAAHPRSRGENTGEIENAVKEAGSSPLARGKRTWPCRGGWRPGLIPARAGKTGCQGTVTPPSVAHPRSRGENQFSAPPGPPTTGSSPLARGKPEPRHDRRGMGRLIPARAGKTGNPDGSS